MIGSLDGAGVPSPTEWLALKTILKFNRVDRRPSLREIAEQMGLRAVSAARVRVLRLAELGLVTYERVGSHGHAAARSIRLTQAGYEAFAEYNAWWAAGILLGKREVQLTDEQYHKVLASNVPLSAFHLRAEGEYTIVVFRNWVERDFWAGEMMGVLGFRDGEGKIRVKECE